jgi:hypothetical protein
MVVWCLRRVPLPPVERGQLHIGTNSGATDVDDVAYLAQHSPFLDRTQVAKDQFGISAKQKTHKDYWRRWGLREIDCLGDTIPSSILFGKSQLISSYTATIPSGYFPISHNTISSLRLLLQRHLSPPRLLHKA